MSGFSRDVLRYAVVGLLALSGSIPALPQGAGEDRGSHTRPHHLVPDHSFADVDRWVEVFEDPDRAEWQKPEEVVRALDLEPGSMAADVGAGTGYFTFPLARAVGPEGRVLAIDIEANMVEHLRERAAEEGTAWVEPLLVPPDDPGIPEGAADCILVVDTYHHIHDRVDYLRRLRRALAPGGEVVVIDFFKRELPVGPPLEHKMARDHVVAEFLEAGYLLRAEETFLPHQYFLRFQPE